ncbi:hypothetical protein RI367_006003 [Sorochytrium milnesiophthora]
MAADIAAKSLTYRSVMDLQPARLPSAPEFSNGSGGGGGSGSVPRKLQHARPFAKSMTLTDAPTVPELARHSSSISSTTDASMGRNKGGSRRSSKASRNSIEAASNNRRSIPIIETDDHDAPAIVCVVTEPEASEAVPVQLSIQTMEGSGSSIHIRRDLSSSSTSQASSSSQISGLGPLEGPPRQSHETENDYLNYLLSRKFSSINFIQKMDSKDVVWMSEQKEPKFIGPYLMGEVIGKGAFGKVKEALCSETLARVAIKILQHKRLRKTQNGVEGVTQEIKLLQRIRHHNCVRLIDVYCKAENPDSEMEIMPWTSGLDQAGFTTVKRYLVFEYCSNNVQAMLDAAPENKLPLKQCQDYFRQLVNGLAYLHSNQIVHRDIKPGNMLLTFDGVIKISDYGVTEKGSMYTDNLLCQTFAGTHQFLSPEVTTGEVGIIGDKIDIWAAGITLYFMWTGTFPFKLIDQNIMSLYEQIQTSPFPVPPGISGDMLDLFTGVLEKSIEPRLSALQVLQHKFVRAVLPDEPYLPIVSAAAQKQQLPWSLLSQIEPMFPELASMRKLATLSDEKLSDAVRESLPSSPQPSAIVSRETPPPEEESGGVRDTVSSPTNSMNSSRPSISVGGSTNLTPFSSNTNISKPPRRSSITSSCASVGMLTANSFVTDASGPVGSQNSLDDRKKQRKLKIAIFGR